MVFNSIFFIFCFLPVFMLIYYLVPGKLRNLLLFLGSLIFYAWGEPVYVILMLFSSIFNYYMGTELERLYYDDRKQKINLIFSIIINLAVLVFFKYYGFLLNTIGGIIGIHIPHPELSLPIGLSFYTFRNLSYLFDIYLSKVSAQRNFLTFSVYSTMFPYTSAGPIVRYADIETQLKQRTSISPNSVSVQSFLSKVLQRKFFWQITSRFYTAVSVVIHRCLYLLHGLAFWLIQCSFILTSAAIRIWPSVWEKCWDLILIRTLIIPIFPPVFLNSGDAGIFLLEAGSEIIFISRLAVIGSPL